MAASWLDEHRIEFLYRHMRTSALRIVPPAQDFEDRESFPLSELKHRSDEEFTSIAICREMLKSIASLHESNVHLNGQISGKSTYIMQASNNRFKIQFELTATEDWSRFQAGMLEGASEDIKAVGSLIQRILSTNLTDGSSKEKGEMLWMERLAEWMTDKNPLYRPNASCCCKHHANWSTDEKIMFTQAFNEYVLQNRDNKKTLESLLPANQLGRLFPAAGDWKIHLQRNHPELHALLSGPKGLKRWNKTLQGKNISHFFQALRDWEMHAYDDIDDKLKSFLKNESHTQSSKQLPTDFLLGRYPELLEFIVFKLVKTEAYTKCDKLVKYIGFYGACRLYYLSPKQRARHE